MVCWTPHFPHLPSPTQRAVVTNRKHGSFILIIQLIQSTAWKWTFLKQSQNIFYITSNWFFHLKSETIEHQNIRIFISKQQLTSSLLLILTITEAILIACFAVRCTVTAFSVCGVIALRTVWPAGVIQEQVLCLTAQTVRGIPLAGCTLWGTRLTQASFRKPSENWYISKRHHRCIMMMHTKKWHWNKEKHLWHSTTHTPCCK